MPFENEQRIGQATAIRTELDYSHLKEVRERLKGLNIKTVREMTPEQRILTVGGIFDGAQTVYAAQAVGSAEYREKLSKLAELRKCFSDGSLTFDQLLQKTGTSLTSDGGVGGFFKKAGETGQKVWGKLKGLLKR